VIIKNFQNVYADMVNEMKNLENYDTTDKTYYVAFYHNAGRTSGNSFVGIDNTGSYTMKSNVTFWFEIRETDNTNGDYTNYNLSTFNDVYNFKFKIAYNSSNNFTRFLNQCWIFAGKGMGSDRDYNINYFTAFSSKNSFFSAVKIYQTGSYASGKPYCIAYVNNGSVTSSAYWNRSGILSWRTRMLDVYNTIKDNMIADANAYWNYLHSLGYYNLSDLPEDYIHVFPDVFLPNMDLLGNLSMENFTALYNAIMAQLAQQLADENITNITWDNFKIGDYVGKTANITLKRVTNTTSGDGEVIIDKHYCYVIPLESDLTIYTNKTYAITHNTNKPAWADNLINQNVMVMDLTTYRTYYIITNETTYYNLTTYDLKEDNNSVNSLDYDVVDPNDFTNAIWGFRFVTPNPEDYIMPVPQDEQDFWDLLNDYKGIITVGCIVLGVILTAGTRKGTGGHTIGILLLVAGLGMAAYWYILPAVNEITSFFDKLTFWD
ncbi:MAG: hypothetical protein J7L31_05325, partial [Thermoplasmata archaeon]|nr:hypothetical protein [Thermoplasmata archaeon]